MPTCPKCQAQMEEGFIVDEWNRLFRAVSTWVQGTPENSIMMGVRLKGKKTIKTRTLRCTKCGYLEGYAQ
jgi:Domain of unknown function (DUF6487)